MARGTTPALDTELNADEISPVLLFEGQFDGGDVRFWTGLGTLAWNSVDWDGAGDFLGFDGLTETGALRAEGTAVSLNGIPSATISLALNEEYQGRPVSLYLGAMTAAGAVVADPYEFASGKADTMTFEEDGERASMSLAIESDMIALRRANKQLYTSERQQIDFPNDLGFEFVPSLQDAQFQFGG